MIYRSLRLALAYAIWFYVAAEQPTHWAALLSSAGAVIIWTYRCNEYELRSYRPPE